MGDRRGSRYPSTKSEIQTAACQAFGRNRNEPIQKPVEQTGAEGDDGVYTSMRMGGKQLKEQDPNPDYNSIPQEVPVHYRADKDPHLKQFLGRLSVREMLRIKSFPSRNVRESVSQKHHSTNSFAHERRIQEAKKFLVWEHHLLDMRRQGSAERKVNWYFDQRRAKIEDIFEYLKRHYNELEDAKMLLKQSLKGKAIINVTGADDAVRYAVDRQVKVRSTLVTRKNKKVQDILGWLREVDCSYRSKFTYGKTNVIEKKRRVEERTFIRQQLKEILQDSRMYEEAIRHLRLDVNQLTRKVTSKIKQDRHMAKIIQGVKTNSDRRQLFNEIRADYIAKAVGYVRDKPIWPLRKTDEKVTSTTSSVSGENVLSVRPPLKPPEKTYSELQEKLFGYKPKAESPKQYVRKLKAPKKSNRTPRLPKIATEPTLESKESSRNVKKEFDVLPDITQSNETPEKRTSEENVLLKMLNVKIRASAPAVLIGMLSRNTSTIGALCSRSNSERLADSKSDDGLHLGYWNRCYGGATLNSGDNKESEDLDREQAGDDMDLVTGGGGGN